jgi:hypothetical protein
MVLDHAGVPVLPETNTALSVAVARPVPTGSPEQLVNTPALGVPSAGVVNEGDTFPAKAPEPEAPVNPFPTIFIVVIFFLKFFKLK